MSWKDYIELEVKDSFAERDKFKKTKKIIDLGVVTMTTIRLTFDNRITNKKEVLTLFKKNK